MKKLSAGMVVIASLIFGAPAQAAYILEKYSGYQSVKQNKSYDFGFDMWYTNWHVGTNSSLKLTKDGIGGKGPWKSATASIGLWSEDSAYERTKWKIEAWSKGGGKIFQDTFKWNGTEKNTGSINQKYEFSDKALKAFAKAGWGNISIRAAKTDKDNYNDFAIEWVMLEVHTLEVPEPGTFGLLALGLLGLGVARKTRR